MMLIRHITRTCPANSQMGAGRLTQRFVEQVCEMLHQSASADRKRICKLPANVLILFAILATSAKA
jgi:hypothetical protein